MDRREFIRALIAGSAAAAAHHAIPFAAASSRLPVSDAPPDWAIGFRGLSDDLSLTEMKVEGRVPRECYGTLYRNGPTLYERAGERYQHWFDPDGMIQAFRLGPAGVTHEGRFVRTRKFLEESKAGRFLYDGAGSQVADPQPASNNDTANPANINIQPLAGELLALWEAGSAHSIDPATLETRGRKIWSDELDGVPFCAHPKYDDRGDLWNIGSVPWLGAPKLVLYHIRADGVLQKTKLHTLDFAGYIHDFVLTPSYLVVLNSSAVFGTGETFVDRMHWDPNRASQLLVFDRNDLSLVRVIEVPAAFVFHFGNGWEDASGLHFTACQYENADITVSSMRKMAQQVSGPLHAPPELMRYDVDLRGGQCSISALAVPMEFPNYDLRRPFNPQTLLGTGEQNVSESGLASALVSVNPQSGKFSRYDYGNGVIVQEPLYLKGGAGDYAMHAFLDYEKHRSGIALFRIDRLNEGPVMTATMDRVLPLGFHGCFLAA
ncbi:MAG: carotenoid oxygenase family protein [Pseudomonadota bacterium]